MGGELSKIESNTSKSYYSPNSAGKSKIESMDCEEENRNTLIYRVWIAKKSITLSDEHVNLSSFKLSCIDTVKFYSPKLNNLKLEEPIPNVFEIKNESNFHFKHWAVILELSNGAYVNIQFGQTGFSLKEFDRTNIAGENILNSILEGWGEKKHPYSFCYLGVANYEYDNLKIFLNRVKIQEEGRKYYNAGFFNCQHFSCDVEKILFNRILIWHSFEYYLDEFFKMFFPDIDINTLTKKHEESIKKKNIERFKENVKKMKKALEEIEKNINNEYVRNDYYEYFIDAKEKLEKLYSKYSLKFDDYINNVE